MVVMDPRVFGAILNRLREIAHGLVNAILSGEGQSAATEDVRDTGGRFVLLAQLNSPVEIALARLQTRPSRREPGPAH